jgi:hypothetical protein
MQAAAEPSPVRASFEPPTLESIQRRFPGYEIESLLGRGGMGAVYRARDRKLDRAVAIKILPPEIGADPEFAERFLREARVLGRLSHVNIVEIYDFGDAGGLPYIVMAHVDSGNLRDALREGRMDPEVVTRILCEVADALAYAHGEGVVHRDIKPENVLLGKDGHARLADFGLVRLVDPDGLSATQQSVGTPYYMAPEQVTQPEAVDARADIYSFGVLAYEMLTGELPVGQFPAASRTPGVGAGFDDLISRCLQRDPALRWDSMGEVRQAVVDRAPGVAVTPPQQSDTVSRRAAKRDGRSPMPAPEAMERSALKLLIALGTVAFLACLFPWWSYPFDVGGRTGSVYVTAWDTRIVSLPGWLWHLLAVAFVALAGIQITGRYVFSRLAYAGIAALFVLGLAYASFFLLSEPADASGRSASPQIGLLLEWMAWIAVCVVLAIDLKSQREPARRPSRAAVSGLHRKRRHARRKARSRRSKPNVAPNDAATDTIG